MYPLLLSFDLNLHMVRLFVEGRYHRDLDLDYLADTLLAYRDLMDQEPSLFSKPEIHHAIINHLVISLKAMKQNPLVPPTDSLNQLIHTLLPYKEQAKDPQFLYELGNGFLEAPPSSTLHPDGQASHEIQLLNYWYWWPIYWTLDHIQSYYAYGSPEAGLLNWIIGGLGQMAEFQGYRLVIGSRTYDLSQDETETPLSPSHHPEAYNEK
ncbi:TPA: hypothetical protein ACGOYX_000942 [Streptococcus suis]